MSERGRYRVREIHIYRYRIYRTYDNIDRNVYTRPLRRGYRMAPALNVGIKARRTAEFIYLDSELPL